MASRRSITGLVACLAAFSFVLLASSCNMVSASVQGGDVSFETGFLKVLGRDPGTLDPQYAKAGDTYALNVFDRLMETREASDGTRAVEPSLAESVEVSSDGLVYTFRLHEGVRFSNGSALTSEDVAFTLERLARLEGSGNTRIVAGIAGVEDFVQGKAGSLAGFTAIDDLTFTITLDRPRPSFLAALSAAGASMLDKQTTMEAGKSFGINPGVTVGTGPFVCDTWDAKTSVTLAANPSCWSGEPACPGVEIEFVADAMPYRNMFREGELDILDISEMSADADYFARGDLYRKNLSRKLRSDITCIVFDASTGPLSDSRVREALAVALDRDAVLKVAAGGRGVLENGIVPSGLSCGSSGIPAVAYDPERARRLLAEAGYGDGFDLYLAYPASATSNEKEMFSVVAYLWGEAGARVTLEELGDEGFEAAAREGRLPCRIVTASASYDDPESIFDDLLAGGQGIGGPVASLAQSPAAEQVAEASAILDAQGRIAAYRAIDESLVEQTHSVIPLYSLSQIFVVSGKVEGFAPSWNGASGIDLRGIAISGGESR